MTLYSLPMWPFTPTPKRRSSAFKASRSDTVDKLAFELGKIGAKNIEIGIGFTSSDLRRDGWPRSGAAPSHPGVVLGFERDGRNYEMPCDRFLDWESNLRAIALTVEGLRMIDRYGVAWDAQQFEGWQLPLASGRGEG